MLSYFLSDTPWPSGLGGKHKKQTIETMIQNHPSGACSAQCSTSIRRGTPPLNAFISSPTGSLAYPRADGEHHRDH
jgi:hypothetical protein